MKICRAIMDLGWGKARVHSSKNPWMGHFEAVMERYQHSPSGYREDLQALAQTAKVRGADLLILPACALILDQQEPLDQLLDSLDFDRLSAGVLRGDKEFAVSKISSGETFTFNSHKSIALSDKAMNLFSAISSSIKHFKNPSDYARLGSGPLRAQGHSIVCDMGHHQYSGRYMLTLKSVSRSLVQQGYEDGGVILSFWKYAGSQSRGDWAVGAKVQERVILQNEIGGHDYLDVMMLDS